MNTYFHNFRFYSGKEFNEIVRNNDLILINFFPYFAVEEFIECKNIVHFSFTDIRFFDKFIKNESFYNLNVIEIPNDAKVYILNNEYKTDKIKLVKKYKNIWDFTNNCKYTLKRLMDSNSLFINYITNNTDKSEEKNIKKRKINSA
jgi:hypothetical protein